MSKNLKQFASYVLMGGLAFGLNLGLTFVLTEYLGFWYLLSVILGTLASWTAMFFLNSNFTFRVESDGKVGVRYLKNIILYLVLAPIGWGLVYVLTTVLGVFYLLSQVIVVASMALISFLLSRNYIFEVTGQRL